MPALPLGNRRVRWSKGAPPEEPALPTHRLRARAALTCGFLANGFGIGAWAGNIPRTKAALSLSATELGLVLLMFAVGAILSMTATGRIAARVGAGRVTAFAGLAFAAVLPLPAVMPSGVALGACVAALGLTSGALDVAMNAHATEVERHWGRAILSSFHAGYSLGGLAGAAMAGALAASGVGREAGLALPAAIVATLALPAFLLRDGPRHPVAPLRLALPGRALLSLCALGFLCMLGEGAMADWTGIYLGNVAGAGAGAAALGFAAFSMAMGVGRLVGDALVRRFGACAVVRAGGAVASAGVALALAAPVPLLGIVGFGLTGLGLANVVPMVFSSAARAGGANPAIGVATAATLGYAGFLFGPPLIGAAADLIGLRLALGLVLAAALGVVGLARAVSDPGS